MALAKKYKYVLVTNCIYPFSDINKEIVSGSFGTIDLRLPPFNIDAAEQVLQYKICSGSTFFVKSTLLIVNE